MPHQEASQKTALDHAPIGSKTSCTTGGNHRSLLVAEGRLNTKGRAVASRSKTGRGVATVPIFLLVPQVKLRKRLDLARDAERAVDGVPGRIVAAWVDGKLT
jgi:hypothetical protein